MSCMHSSASWRELSWKKFVMFVFGFFGLLFSKKTRSANGPSFWPSSRAPSRKPFISEWYSMCCFRTVSCSLLRADVWDDCSVISISDKGKSYELSQSNTIFWLNERGDYQSFFTHRDVICQKQNIMWLSIAMCNFCFNKGKSLIHLPFFQECHGTKLKKVLW